MSSSSKSKVKRRNEKKVPFHLTGFTLYLRPPVLRQGPLKIWKEHFTWSYFRKYPFDKQYCYIEIALFQDLWDFVKVEDQHFSYLGPKDLRDYTIRNASMSRVNDDRLQVKFTIDRRLVSLILTTFLPTIILNTIGHMSNYFNEHSFDAYMSLNVTVMLALTTMFVG